MSLELEIKEGNLTQTFSFETRLSVKLVLGKFGQMTCVSAKDATASHVLT